MLKIQVIAIGKVKEDWMRQGIAEYQKRLGAYCRFEIIELEEYRLPDNPSEAEIARGLEEEGNRILKKAAGLIFPLCIEGEMLSSPQLAQLISSSAQKSGCLSFIIGGSFGLSPRVKAAAARKISFSQDFLPVDQIVEDNRSVCTFRIYMYQRSFHFTGYCKYPVEIHITISIQKSVVSCIFIVYMKKRKFPSGTDMIMNEICRTTF